MSITANDTLYQVAMPAFKLLDDALLDSLYDHLIHSLQQLFNGPNLWKWLLHIKCVYWIKRQFENRCPLFSKWGFFSQTDARHHPIILIIYQADVWESIVMEKLEAQALASDFIVLLQAFSWVILLQRFPSDISQYGSIEILEGLEDQWYLH